jgi:hypothetical protein
MKFRHKLYASAIVRAGRASARFSDHELETEDADLIAVLRKNPEVEEVKPKRRKKEEDSD